MFEKVEKNTTVSGTTSDLHGRIVQKFAWNPPHPTPEAGRLLAVPHSRRNFEGSPIKDLHSNGVPGERNKRKCLDDRAQR